MSARIDRSWVVVDSIENDQHDRCAAYASKDVALNAAVEAVAWLAEARR
jgi:hypothetical protein